MPTARPGPRRLSTRSYLLLLVASVVVPLLMFAAFLLYRFAAAEQRRFESEAAQIARQVGLVVDGELASILASLQGLASSSALARGDLPTFYEEARRLSDQRGVTVLLRSLGSEQLLNSQRPFGAPLPPAVPITAEERARFDQGRNVVGRVYAAPMSGETRVAIAVPVVREGRLSEVLAMTVPTSRFRDSVRTATPEGWLIGVGDRDGTIVTRSARHEEVTGKPGLPEYLAKAVGRAGTFTSRGFDGTTVLAGYYRSEFSEWLYGANVLQTVVEAPLRRSMAAFGLLGLAALTLSALLAYRFSKNFALATTGLARGALALGEGRPVGETPTRLTEFAIVGEALKAAAAAIEKRTRELETVLATVPAAVWFTYDPEVRRVMRNRFAADLMKVPLAHEQAFSHAEGHFGQTRLLHGNGTPVLPEDLPLRRAMRGERFEDEEYTFVFSDGSGRTLLTSGSALRDEEGRILGGVLVGLDITERKQAEDQRRLLLHELNHRVKNTLATVQSIALQTLRSGTSIEHAREALSDRLVALAQAHDTLTRESWEGAELHRIVSGAVAPHRGGDRFEIEGPQTWVSPGLSLSLALALHELATNAAKYGALSTETGRVRITWQIQGTGETARLRLVWQERGGPRVEIPTHKGFGSRLIERSFSAEVGGSAKIEFQGEGVVCTIEAPLLAGGSRPAAPALPPGIN